jgi:hypothetical protein
MVMGDLDDYHKLLEEDASLAEYGEKKHGILDTYEWLHRRAIEQQSRRSEPPPPARTEPVNYMMADTRPYVRTTPKIRRNDPCPCGSGRKYKHCHGKK